MKQDTSHFFRSINLGLDVDYPDRFAHYYPTSKSANVIRSIVRGDPEPVSIVVASYGSGKSLAAGAAAQIVANNPKTRKHLRDIAKRLETVDSSLCEYVLRRANSKVHGLPILLEGYESSLANALLDQANEKIQYLRKQKDTANNIAKALNAIVKRAQKKKIDHISIVWDEFGHHLGSLAAAGKAEALLEVQQLAEWVARQSKPSASLTLLLHQNLFQYAGNLSQSARSSWRKIEGRFNLIRYVEDSNEMYDLIASVVSELRPDKFPQPLPFIVSASKTAAEIGIFSSYGPRDKLLKIFDDASPLLPVTLFMLPRTASRLAQNERTIFSFLAKSDLSKPVSLLDLYRYFSTSMEVDTGVGGSYRRWLETESALSKVSEQIQKEIIAAAALLGLGGSGERAHVSKQTLAFAVMGVVGHDMDVATKAIDKLIKRKLLLYRKNNDDISVWHGTDIDVRSRLQTERDKLEGNIDIITFLDKEHTPASWRPTAHNVRNSIRRYYRGRYVLASELIQSGEKHPVLSVLPEEDGVIVYCIAENKKEIATVCDFARGYKASIGTRLVFAIPKEPMPIAELVSEILALRNLQKDAEFIASDPFVMPELQHMIDAAQENLALVIHRLVFPDGTSSTWFADEKPIRLNDDSDLRSKLSKYADRWYKYSPVVNNELIVRQHVSRPMVNARKKLILGILERTGTPNLDFRSDATTPDTTLYRTVLWHTKLYSTRAGKWQWSNPSTVPDQGLSRVWEEIKDFFATPGEGKEPAVLIKTLVQPPYGTRMGLMPILLAGGMQAFGKAFAIRREGVYLQDILASEIEDICSSPNQYTVDVFQFNKASKIYLTKLIDVFSLGQRQDTDLLRQLYDSIVAWRARLPKQALTSRQVNKKAQRLQKLLRGDIDPAQLAFSTFPTIMGDDYQDKHWFLEFHNLVHEIEKIVDGYTARAIEAIREHLAISPDVSGNVLQRAHAWATCLASSTNGSGIEHNHISKAVLSRCLDASNGKYTESSFARALSAILLGRDFEQWDDASIHLFLDKLREVASGIEDTALRSPKPSKDLAPLLERRIQYLNDVLKRLQVVEKTSQRTKVAAKK